MIPLKDCGRAFHPLVVGKGAGRERARRHTARVPHVGSLLVKYESSLGFRVREALKNFYRPRRGASSITRAQDQERGFSWRGRAP